jgi:trk system potassium uptake protein TrkH
LRQSLVLQDALSHQTVGQLRQVVVFIVIITFTFEITGAVAIYTMFAPRHATVLEGAFHALFHAISAFCNAGFALQSDSLAAFGQSWALYCGIVPLIVVGGLGFPVLLDMWQYVGAARLRRRGGTAVRFSGTARCSRASLPRSQLNLHTKLVLSTTASLIIVPTIMLMFFELPTGQEPVAHPSAGEAPRMSDLSTMGRAGAAFFQAVTVRTAGFNTVAMDAEALSPGSVFLLMLLMFVGGSPGSTAGGVKTVAVAVLALAVITSLRRRRNVEAFGRTIPEDAVRLAAAVVTVMFGVVSAVTLALAVTESAPLQTVLFESVSACGTVGLSAGLTGELTTEGRIIIMFAMFAGRLGPLTVMIALAGGTAPVRYDYPPEQVTIG